MARAKKPKRLPVAFTPEEAMAVIEQLLGVRWLMGSQLYGGGLRLMECLLGRPHFDVEPQESNTPTLRGHAAQ